MATPAQLLVLFREDVDDDEGGVGGTDFLWSDDEFYRYLDRAQIQFAKDTLILKTATIAALVDIAVTADDPVVTPDTTVLHPTRAKLLLGTRTLKIVPFEELDESGLFTNDYGDFFSGDWEIVTGTPRCLITNWDETIWRLAPIPVVSDTLKIITTYLPQSTITVATKDAAIDVTNLEDQYIMLDYAKYLAYRKQDADVYDVNLSNMFLASYKADAAMRKREAKRLRHQSQPVRYGGIPLS